MAAMTADEKRSLIDSVPFWFHSIDCGDGPMNTSPASRTALANHSRSDKKPYPG